MYKTDEFRQPGREQGTRAWGKRAANQFGRPGRRELFQYSIIPAFHHSPHSPSRGVFSQLPGFGSISDAVRNNSVEADVWDRAKTNESQEQIRRLWAAKAGRSSFQAKRGAVGALAIGAQAVGALALGALAVGTLAVGRLLIKRLAVRRARIHSFAIDEPGRKRLRR
jgi:hypothetical protein